MAVAFEMSPHNNIVERNRYTVTAAFGEIGGVYTVMAFLLTLLVRTYNFNAVPNFLVANMFRLEKE